MFSKKISAAVGLLLAMLSAGVSAASFPGLDTAMPDRDSSFPKDSLGNLVVPVFDFDADGCLPAAGFSRAGDPNPGLRTTGSIAGGCRNTQFLDYANTVHRHMCTTQQGDEYCVHFYSLYFEKDQLTFFGLGHRHDWEHVALWTKNGVTTHGSYSAHGDLFTRSWQDLPTENTTYAGSQATGAKFVYHKDGILTHAMRFAKDNEVAENNYGRFVLPAPVSWYYLSGDNVSNVTFRNLMNNRDFGSATVPMRDDNFVTNANEARPAGYPLFAQTDAQAADPNPPVPELYSSCHYALSEKKVLLEPGTYTQSRLQYLGLANDSASSIRIPSTGGWQVNTFTDDNFAGAEQAFVADFSCFVDMDYNDRISSVTVTNNAAPLN